MGNRNEEIQRLRLRIGRRLEQLSVDEVRELCEIYKARMKANEEAKTKKKRGKRKESEN